MGHQRLPQSAHDPFRVGKLQRPRSCSRPSSRPSAAPVQAATILGRHLAQHRVDQRRRPGADDRAGQSDGLVQGRMRRNPHGQQLVRPDPQRIQNCRIQLLQRPVHAAGQDGVVGALPAQRPVASAPSRNRRPACPDGAAGSGPARPGSRKRPRPRPRCSTSKATSRAGSARRVRWEGAAWLKPRRILRFRSRPCASRLLPASPRLAPVVPPRLPPPRPLAAAGVVPAHSNTTPSLSACPRAQSLAPHHLLAGRLHRTPTPRHANLSPPVPPRPQGPPARVSAPPIRAAVRTGSSLTRWPSSMVQAPGSRVTPRTRRPMASAGCCQSMRPSSRVSLGASETVPVLRHGDRPARRRWRVSVWRQQHRAAVGEPFQQRPGWCRRAARFRSGSRRPGPYPARPPAGT